MITIKFENDNPSFALGIDLGGTKLSAALIDANGLIVSRELIKTNLAGPTAVVSDIVNLVKNFKIKGLGASSVGVGMAGQIVKENGTVLFAPNLGWKDFPLGIELEKALGVPVYIINDVRAATYGEWIYGAGKDCSDLLCLFFGTGIGSGVVSGGMLLSGSDNAFGEVGHMTIDLHGSLCTCGNRGCFETKASGWGLAKIAKEMLLKNPRSGQGLLKLVSGITDNITTNHIFEAFSSKDPFAILIVEEFKEALIAGVASLLNLYNPKVVILGGGIIQGNPELIKTVQLGVIKRALKATSQNVKIVPAMLGNDAGIIGAATLARTLEK